MLDSGTSPGGSQIKGIRSGEGKMPIPGPHSSILQIGRRSLDTAYRILHARIQHTGYYMQGYRTHRTHRIQDEGHIGCRRNTPKTLRSLVAPLRGGRRIYIIIYICIYVIYIYINIYIYTYIHDAIYIYMLCGMIQLRRRT